MASALADLPAVSKTAADQRPTLLVCDDEEGPRQSLRIVFKNDYRVVVASNGDEAIELAKKESIDVAVLDILMHGMSGVDVLRELKKRDPNIEVVMLTAYETLETARQALRLGACDYLNKPFDIPTMREAVQKALAKRREAQAFRGTAVELETLQYQLTEQREREEMARTKGEIYASVLHDLNSPLTVISGFVELINRSMHSASSVEGAQLDTLRDDLNRVHDEVSRCFEISRRYLSFLSAQRVESTYISVGQMLADLRDLLARHPSAKDHRLHIEDLRSDVIAEINGTDFLQILLNLTINAFQATDEPHNVEIHARHLTRAISLDSVTDGPEQLFINREGFRNEAPMVAISVGDNGPGIPPHIVAKMFKERFTTKTAGNGTGLGLSIVRRLVEEANAGLHLRTRPGHGATFTLMLKVLP